MTSISFALATALFSCLGLDERALPPTGTPKGRGAEIKHNFWCCHREILLVQFFGRGDGGGVSLSGRFSSLVIFFDVRWF